MNKTLALLFIMGCVLGCVPGCVNGRPQPELPPPESPDMAPLPPESDSVIGFLLYHEKDLELTAEQRTKLEQIDHDLETENGPLIVTLEQQRAPGAAQGTSQPTRSRHHQRGGAYAGANGNMASTGGGGGGGGGKKQQQPQQQTPMSDADKAKAQGQADDVADAQKQIDANNAAALSAAGQVLTEPQRQVAQKLFDDLGRKLKQSEHSEQQLHSSDPSGMTPSQ